MLTQLSTRKGLDTSCGDDGSGMNAQAPLCSGILPTFSVLSRRANFCLCSERELRKLAFGHLRQPEGRIPSYSWLGILWLRKGRELRLLFLESWRNGACIQHYWLFVYSKRDCFCPILSSALNKVT